MSRLSLKPCLANAAYPREKNKIHKNWFSLSHFKTYYSDYFEGAEALIESGIKDHPIVKEAIEKAGNLCLEEKTWNCQLARTWHVKFERKDKPSPWLSLRGMKIITLLE